MKEKELHFRRVSILVVLAVVSAAFLYLVRDFLIPLLLAAIFVNLASSVHKWILKRLGNRQALAAGLTLLVLIMIVLLPLLAILGLVVDQAAGVTTDVVPWIKERLESPQATLQLPDWVPFRDTISTGQISAKIGQVAERAGSYVVANLSAASKGTADFLLKLFIMLYAMYNLFLHSGALKRKISQLIPLGDETKDQLFEKGRSVAVATIKGTIVIGLIQGLLGGIALHVAGIGAAALWGALMAVASIIPAVGTALVWVPCVGYLFMQGETGWAVGLLVFFALVVGSIDNVLRPKLVGGETQLPDLLILISTLGGLAAFGIAGLIIGPVLAALFISMLGVYQTTFSNVLTGEQTETLD